MTEDEGLSRLSLVDRLELVAFDLELRRGPQALVEAMWDGWIRFGRQNRG